MQINQSNDNKIEKYDVVILGGGAAGLSAGLYSTRAMLSTLVLESVGYGGQVLITDVIENYPGFPEGVKGPLVKNISICTTMGPSIKLDQSSMEKMDQAV